MVNKKTAYPLVTIGVLSWNRLHYLKATLESARRCIHYPNIEWIVSDNMSVEPGLREYIQGLNWVDYRLFQTQSHAEAMNQIVNIAKGEYVIIWPEDVQFTVEGDWLVDIIEILQTNPMLGSVALNYLRRQTYTKLYTWQAWLKWRQVLRQLKRRGLFFPRSKLMYSSRNFAMRTFGWVWPGVVGSGIPSLARTELWKRLGAWQTTQKRTKANLIDSSLGAEAYMERQYYTSSMNLQQAIPIIPIAADIVTDNIGSKAKVRGNKRYGVYLPPPDGTYYYQIKPQSYFDSYKSSNIPIAFEDAVQPIGFDLPFDAEGNLLKASVMNTSIITEL